jgi:hypothetical protein
MELASAATTRRLFPGVCFGCCSFADAAESRLLRRSGKWKAVLHAGALQPSQKIGEMGQL